MYSNCNEAYFFKTKENYKVFASGSCIAGVRGDATGGKGGQIPPYDFQKKEKLDDFG